MELILVVLCITSVYFSTRFFLISRNIDKVIEDFKYISENEDTNRKFKLSYPDKKSEKLLIAINEYLEETQRYKLRYVKREEEIRAEIENISHDLRTPLTSIRGYIELINDEDITDKEKKDYIGVVDKRARVLQDLIQDFYDLSRLENSDYSFNTEIVDINKELREQVLMFYNDFENKNIDVDIRLCESPVFVKLDKSAINRVFHNLLQNATKYSDSKFEVLLSKKGDQAVIEFRNDVVGMSKDELDLLFNRFYMKDSSRGKDSSGLGLTITKFLVDAMNGEMEVKLDEEWIVFSVKFLDNRENGI